MSSEGPYSRYGASSSAGGGGGSAGYGGSYGAGAAPGYGGGYGAPQQQGYSSQSVGMNENFETVSEDEVEAEIPTSCASTESCLECFNFLACSHFAFH